MPSTRPAEELEPGCLPSRPPEGTRRRDGTTRHEPGVPVGRRERCLPTKRSAVEKRGPWAECRCISTEEDMKKLLALGAALAIVVWSVSGPVLAQDARAALGEASKAMGVETMTIVDTRRRASISRSVRHTTPARPGQSSSTRATSAPSISAHRHRRSTASGCRAKTRPAAAASSRSSATRRRARRSSSPPRPRGCSSSRSG